MNREQLSDFGIESKETIDAIMKIYGEGVNEVKKQLGDRDATIAELNEQIQQLSNTGDEIESLKSKVQEYEKADAERKKQAKEAEKEQKMMARIDSVLADKQFVNDLTKEGVINLLKVELAKEGSADRDIKEIFEDVTKDTNNIFANPNAGVVIMPTGTAKKGTEKAKIKEFI